MEGFPPKEIIMSVYIGQYSEMSKKFTDSIKDNISDVPIRNKGTVLNYLRRGKTLCASTGYVIDAFTGKNSFVRNQMYSDGMFSWSSKVIYYFEKYNLKLPQDFIDYVLNKYAD